MKPKHCILVTCFLLLLCSVSLVHAQDEKPRYGNTPAELAPYENFQKAYDYHFLTPMQFYGAGREEPAPMGLKEVRIGFLGPLSGSNLVPLGKTNDAGRNPGP